MRAKLVNEIPTFTELIKIAPIEIQDYLERCKITNQTQPYHPEGNVYIHINIVYNRARKSGDINQAIGAFFHDLGKADVTRKHPTIPDKWPAKYHEKVSGKLALKYKDWIEELGADFDIVYYIIDQHMRVKDIDIMRKHKQDIFRSEPYFKHVDQFTQYDI
jgi:hypothetical protein